MKAMTEQNRTDFKVAEERLNRLELAIQKEKSDCVTETDERTSKTEATI